MNIQEYISSGIVESYVLGLASEEERAEFENLSAQYPELVEARSRFERALEKRSQDYGIHPPPQLKETILQSLGEQANPKARVIRVNPWKWVSAACLVLLAGSIYLNLLLTQRNQANRRLYEQNQAGMNDMKEDMGIMQQNPAVKMASLKGQAVSPQSYSTIFWDTVTHNVYLLVNNLPAPPSGKQYQIWALLDGKHIDLGLIDNDYFVRQNRLLIKAQNVQKAQAFAITLEEKGGSPAPNGQMYVMGNP